MEHSEALKIIKSLADGIDPQTGEVFPDTSPYQNPKVVRALFVAAGALEQIEEKQKRQKPLPENAGKPWTSTEDKLLSDSFDKGMSVQELAQRHKRTEWSIQARLEKLGKAVPNQTFVRRYPPKAEERRFDRYSA
jgi:hypothetical protein